MVEGTVKFFDRTKNYGFIDGDDGKSYFVHATGLKEGVEIGEGDKVSFKATKGEKGLKAEGVEKLKESKDDEDQDSSEEESEDESEEDEVEEEDTE